MSGVSLVFPAYNRLEFTKQAWAALMANTDWSLVEEFHVYDDGSTDGTHDFLAEEFDRIWCQPVRIAPGERMDMAHLIKAEWHDSAFRSPMGVTLDWIRRSKAPLLAKLDNDTIYPPGWLNVALDVMKRHPELDMLGLECMRKPARLSRIAGLPVYEDVPITLAADVPILNAPAFTRYQFGYLPAVFISGLGIYKRAAFAKSLPQDNGYFGLEEWQQAQSHLKYGWILPSLPVFLLDRMPIEQWKSLSEEYVRKGWQRKWSLDLRYKPEQSPMWDWWRPVA